MNEWEWIEFLRHRVANAPGVAKTFGIVGVGDDCAVLRAFSGQPLVTTDTFVENIHFRAAWSDWAKIGRKMAEASLSDIAAMGGRPVAMVVALSAHASIASVAAPGLLEGILASGVPLAGGDTTGAVEGSLTVTITVMGEASKPILRSGAREGDCIWVSGPLGGAAAGLRSLTGGLGLTDCERRFLEPRARVELAASWAARATAMIDISDGLASELHHLANESGVRMVVDAATIPTVSGIEAAGDPLELALSSGEEFELLATAPSIYVTSQAGAGVIDGEHLPGGICIGHVEKGEGVVFSDGRDLPRAGWTHWL